MNRLLLVILILLSIYQTYAQIPVFNSNVNDDFKAKSLLFKKLKHKYDFLIAYHVEGITRMKNAKIQIIAVKNKKWRKLTFIYEGKSCLKRRLISKKIDKSIGNELIANLGKENFWTLENDSINYREIKSKPPVTRKPINDTVFVIGYKPERTLVAIDGGSYYLQMMQGDNLRVYKSNNPDFYFKYYPQFLHIGNFIRSRDAFIDAFGTF
ncbi:hypothetical protein ACQKCH_16280 [Nubsella zeaxanthinifaciens]|uniref:hypothetical protein n=1 Tax=Nubsella zeaxanthinifaciens TaxID=392412 RepID=UPI003D0375F6